MIVVFPDIYQSYKIENMLSTVVSLKSKRNERSNNKRNNYLKSHNVDVTNWDYADYDEYKNTIQDKEI